MTHPLVTQLRFTRSEFKRGLEGVTDEEGNIVYHVIVVSADPNCARKAVRLNAAPLRN